MSPCRQQTRQGLIHQSRLTLLGTHATLLKGQLGLERQLPVSFIFLHTNIIWHHGMLMCIFSLTPMSITPFPYISHNPNQALSEGSLSLGAISGSHL